MHIEPPDFGAFQQNQHFLYFCSCGGTMMITDSDKKFLEMALNQADENIGSGGGPFGAIIVREGDVIAMSGNRVVAEADPTAHAEVLAIRRAAALLGTHILSDCVLYTSCEPCPMCLGAIYWAGIPRVVYAATRDDAAAAGFNDDLIYREIALDPSERQVSFERSGGERGRQVFERWVSFPGKIPY
jgi:guanine deaminase